MQSPGQSLAADTGYDLAASQPTAQPAIPSEPTGFPDTAVDWCLGIDVGTTEITAALFNQETQQHYPIVWQESDPDPNPARLSGLPAIAYLSAQQLERSPEAPATLSYRALESELMASGQPGAAPTGLLLSHFKPYLNAAIAYQDEQTQDWHPVLQWSDQQPLALRWVQTALVALLSALQGKHESGLIATIAGTSATDRDLALKQLTSIVISCPIGWSDTYCFNLREAVLATGLVTRPDQIYFVEDAIAALLDAQHKATTTGHDEPSPYPTATSNATTPLTGATLVISAGATTTELLLVDLPVDRAQLTREDLYRRSISYAGDAIDQDIICQILYPSAWNWDSLDLQSLDLPLPGEPDQQARNQLNQRLRGSDLGRHLLNAARQLKLALCQNDAATFQLSGQQWTVNQQDLHSRVTLPYLQQLNRELNALLNQSGIVVQAVRQVICVGGTTALPAIAHWLKQKLPNTHLIQDHSPTTDHFRIARGLALLPLYPQMLDSVRHQYGEYFLLHELIRVLPAEPLSVGRILQLLESQGINTNFCQRTILSFLEGQLPAGLLPTKTSLNLLTIASRHHPDYQLLTTTPLFFREGNQIYGFNPDVRDRLQRYLTAILATAHQTLAEPLMVELGVGMAGGIISADY